MIVVTGGAGFIGSCLVARLNEEGREDLVIVDHFEDEDIKRRNLEGKKYLRFCDKSDFLETIRNGGIGEPVEAVLHMGACSSTTLTDADYYRTNNYEYSIHVCEWSLEKKARFIYASSAATYGGGELGYSDEHDIIPRLKPLNLYGQSKQDFDLWVLKNKLEDRAVGLKFFNVFGPNEYHKGDMRSVVAKSYAQVAGDGVMRLFKSYHPDYADGEQKRDFIYVRDAVDIVMFFLGHPEANGIFNVGTGRAGTWNELAQSLFKAAGKEPRIEYIEMPEHLRPRYQYFTQADVRKLRRAGYDKPFTPLADAVKDYCGYLHDNRCL